VSAWQSNETVASATRNAPEKTRKESPRRPKIVKIIGECSGKTDNQTSADESTKVELIDAIVDKLGEPHGSYVIEACDVRYRLQTEFRVEEGWIYKPRRTSPPGTHEEQEEQEREDASGATAQKKTEYEKSRERNQE
jgi:hypothetical protein